MEEKVSTEQLEAKIHDLENHNEKLSEDLQAQSDILIENIELKKENEDLKKENEKLQEQIKQTEEDAIKLVDVICDLQMEKVENDGNNGEEVSI